jgi:competence protein ComEC
MTLIFVCLGWLGGIYLGQIAATGVDRGLLLQQTQPCFAALIVLATLAAFLGRDDRPLRETALVVLFALLGIWRAFASVPDAGIIAVEPGVTAIRGTIAGRPESQDANLQLVLEVSEEQRDATWQPAQTRVLVRTPRYEDWSYGDRVVAYGDLKAVERGAGFWGDYLARQGIYSTMDFAQLRLEERPQGLDFLRGIDVVRGRLQQLCETLLPEPQASLLAGILVGGKAGMPQDFRDALNTTSTSHLIAVSGYNVTVVAGVAQLLALRFLARRKATLLALAAVWGYSLLTGLPPSATRAAIMGTMSLASILVGRDSDALPFLCLSGAVMVGLDPQMLYDLGFQLSFLATAGLVLLEPTVRNGLGRLRIPGWLASSLSVTLAAQIATLPVLAANFHTLSLVSPLSNLLIAPILPGLMATGAAAVALGAVALPLGQVAAPIAWLYLTYMVEVVRWTALLPAAVVLTGNLAAVQIGLYYLLLLLVSLWRLPEMSAARAIAGSVAGRAPRWAVAGMLAALLGVAVLAVSDRPDGKTHVYFLDVGGGDATLIRTGDGRNILVDGGPSPTALAGSLGRRLPFLARDLDAVVLTGYQQDRLAGLMEVARRQPIGLVLQPGRPGGGGAAGAWTDLLRERGVRTVQAAPGQRIDLGSDSWLEVAWASDPGIDEKDAALAVRLEADGVGVLLAGDLPPEAQQEIAGSASPRFDVVRVPSHGATDALDDSFLRSASPRVAMLSVAANNRLGLPADTTLESLRGTNLFRTDQHGTVELVIDHGGYEVYTER